MSTRYSIFTGKSKPEQFSTRSHVRPKRNRPAWSHENRALILNSIQVLGIFVLKV